MTGSEMCISRSIGYACSNAGLIMMMMMVMMRMAQQAVCLCALDPAVLTHGCTKTPLLDCVPAVDTDISVRRHRVVQDITMSCCKSQLPSEQVSRICM